MYLYKHKKKLILFCLLTFFSGIFISTEVFSREIFVRTKEDIKKHQYYVGPGDRLLVKIFQTSQFDSKVVILPDGTINLPRIGSVYVEGLSIDEVKEKLTSKYKVVLKKPILYVDLINTRAIKVNITGQVQRPGIYSLGINNNNSLSNTDGGESIRIQSKGWPTLIDALQAAGGLKSDGNLKDILLIRSDENSKSKFIYKLDYWNPLRTGFNLINPLIYDGDSIRVSKVKTIDLSESKLISDSNFSPASISVNIIGEVTSPGLKQIKANSPLINGILSAGGFTNRSSKQNIKLIRLNNNGSISITKHNFNNSNNFDNLDNPNLKDGDTVQVGKNFYTKGTDTLNTLAKPINPIINSIGLLKIISD